MAAHTFNNWNNSAHSTPGVIVTPKSVDELIEVVKDGKRYPSPVRAVGHFHSMNECFATVGTQVLMNNFTHIHVDVVNKTITVGAYVTMTQIRNALRPHGMQTEVTPEIGNASAGSVACCGSKDASLGKEGLGQVSSTVIGVKMVNSKGEVEEVTLAGNPERMRAIRCSYGLFGIIYQITFRIQEFVLLKYRYESLRLEPAPSIGRVFGNSDGVLGFAQPYYKRLIVERRTVIDKGARISVLDRVKRKLRDQAWENYATFFTTKLPYNWWFTIFDRLLNWSFVSIDLLGGYRARRSDSMINFKQHRSHYFDFTFWAIPVSQWERMIPEYLKFCANYRKEMGFRASLPAEVYFIRRENHSLLSFSQHEDVFTLDLVDSRPNDPLWRRMNRKFNRLAASFGGRPLLNQTKELDEDVVHQTLAEEWKKFLVIHRDQDPHGRFLNTFFAAFLSR